MNSEIFEKILSLIKKIILNIALLIVKYDLFCNQLDMQNVILKADIIFIFS